MLGTDADELAIKLARATMRVAADYAAEDVIGEESFSEQLCGRLKETLEDFETENIKWQADVVTTRSGFGRLKGRTLSKWEEEPALGADIVMVLDVTTPEFVVRKGFLAQAKRLEVGATMDSTEHRRLIGQCEKMLLATPSSMVFLYSIRGVHVVPAAAVLQHRGRNLYDIETYSIGVLYRDFAICWFGDPSIQATERLTLEILRERMEANAALRVEGTAKEPKVRDRME